MPAEADVPKQVHFFGLGAAQFDEIVQAWGWPRFRGQQVRDWVYAKAVADPAAMSNLRRADQELLGQHIGFATSTVAASQQSSDGTEKLLLTWENGANAETVMIPDGPRRTACVSSQVGCPVGCKFCASGVNGVKGNLTAGQIVEQIFRLNANLNLNGNVDGNANGTATSNAARQRINHVVFMGMGEPLANYANVIQAVRVMHDLQAFNIGARKITISTVGIPARMRELAGEDLPLNLAISLHAPNEALRKQLIPWAEHFALEDILDAARYYFERTGREVTLEYILLSGVNDQPDQARQLAKLCKTLRANVNLIRYNEVQGLPFGRPKSDDVVHFQDVLRNAGVNAHVRKSRGRDIDAACGQLRRNKLEPVQVAIPGAAVVG